LAATFLTLFLVSKRVTLRRMRRGEGGGRVHTFGMLKGSKMTASGFVPSLQIWASAKHVVSSWKAPNSLHPNPTGATHLSWKKKLDPRVKDGEKKNVRKYFFHEKIKEIRFLFFLIFRKNYNTRCVKITQKFGSHIQGKSGSVKSLRSLGS
jgi:hypothetical protein